MKTKFCFGTVIMIGFLLTVWLCTPSFSADRSQDEEERAPECSVESDSGRRISEFCKDSCQTVIGASKLLISLCTGIFVLVPSFIGAAKKRFIRSKWLLILGFIVISISVFTGVNVIYFLAGSQRWGNYDILETHIGMGALLQLMSFAAGAILVGLFLLVNTLQSEPVSEAKFSEAQIRVLLARAEIYKIKEEYEKAEALLDIIAENIKKE